VTIPLIATAWVWVSSQPAKSCFHLALEWQEIGGPVVAPDKPSYGISTICDLIPSEFGGTVDLAPEGVRNFLVAG
jgi:hypothetical protein